jgi:hypothetical protein
MYITLLHDDVPQPLPRDELNVPLDGAGLSGRAPAEPGKWKLSVTVRQPGHGAASDDASVTVDNPDLNLNKRLTPSARPTPPFFSYV